MAWVAGVITEFVGGYETAPFELVQTFEVGDKKVINGHLNDLIQVTLIDCHF